MNREYYFVMLRWFYKNFTWPLTNLLTLKWQLSFNHNLQTLVNISITMVQEEELRAFKVRRE
jgi:hypothetical protein